MTRTAGVGAAVLALCACATGSGPALPLSDPAVQRLLALDVAAYFATVAIATDLGRGCSALTLDAELESQVNQQRNSAGRGSRAALGQRAAITLETDVMRRSFAARHPLGTPADLCAAAQAERDGATAIGALLMPV